MWKKRERCLRFYVVTEPGFTREKEDTAICQTIRKSRKPQEEGRSGVRSEPSAGRGRMLKQEAASLLDKVALAGARRRSRIHWRRSAMSSGARLVCTDRQS